MERGELPVLLRRRNNGERTEPTRSGAPDFRRQMDGLRCSYNRFESTLLL